MTDLAAVGADVSWPDPRAELAAREQLAGQTARLGRLSELAAWVASVQDAHPAHDFRRVRLLVTAADHGIATAGVSAATTTTSQQALALSESLTPFTDLAGASLRILDVGSVEAGEIAQSSGRIDRADALSRTAAQQGVDLGMRIADEEIDSGADLIVLGGLGVAATTVASTFISVLTNTEPARVVGRGSGIDDDAWMRKAAAIRDARRRGMTARTDPVGLLAIAGGADLAVGSGLVMRAAIRRTPVLLDGTISCAAALLAFETQPRLARWWQVGQLSPEPGHARALRKLGLEAILDLGMRSEDGRGALMAVPTLRAAARVVSATSAHV